MPPQPHSKPENVLKRAQELIQVDQSLAALTTLHEHIISKKSRNTPIVSLEPVILLFVDLCVQLRKGKIAKDGLYQYKNIAQNTSVQTIETVLKHFITESEQKVTEAQEKAEEITVQNVDDLEAIETPESILLSTVSGEQSKDRTDRAVVTPWLKFLWETYRTVLDILRNNARLEVLYQSTAHQAFGFCLKYQRKTEFRRLCELLRNHVQNAAKYAHQLHAINLNDPETLQRHLDTRFQQLNAAVDLELWQEAFRSVEDIHHLMTVSKRPPKTNMMANYYEKLARIFLVSDNYLYHAAAWNKYYNLLRTQLGNIAAGTQTKKDFNVTDTAMAKAASFVFLSTLSIPVISTSRFKTLLETGEEARKIKNSRLTNLLNMSQTPSRTSLLKDALSKGLLKSVKPEIRELYNFLESDFHPLSICKRISPILEKIAADAEMKMYIAPLHQVVLTRLFQQLSQVYDTVQMEFVFDLVQFPGPFEVTKSSIEKFICNGCKKGDLSIRLDHAAGVMTFEQDVFSMAKPLSPLDDGIKVQKLQNTPSEIVRTQLSRIAKAAQVCLPYIDPSYIQEQENRQAEALARAKIGVEQERQDMVQRFHMISEKKQAAETAAIRREKDESAQKAAAKAREQAAEADRVAKELEKRETVRLQNEMKKLRQQEYERQLKELKDTQGLDPSILGDIGELDQRTIHEIKIAHLEKQKATLDKHLGQTAKRVDHLVRAYRRKEEEVVPLDYNKQKERDRTSHVEREKVNRETAIRKHADDIALKSRLEKKIPYYDSFVTDVKSRRHDEFEKRRKAADRTISAEMDKRRKAHKEKLERERKRVEEEERLRKEQEEKEEREEEEREAEEERKRKEAEEKRAQRDAERHEAAEQSRKQREREEEAERRRVERRTQEQTERARPPPTRSVAAAAPEPALARTQVPSSGGWRERLAQKEAAAASGGSSAAPPPTQDSRPSRRPETSNDARPGSRPETPDALRPGPGAYRPGALKGVRPREGGDSMPPPSDRDSSRLRAPPQMERQDSSDGGAAGDGANKPRYVRGGFRGGRGSNMGQRSDSRGSADGRNGSYERSDSRGGSSSRGGKW